MVPLVHREAPAAPRHGRPCLSVLAGLGLAVLPKCPACWLAYSSLAGAAGLGRLSSKPWLLPVIAVLLALATLSFWLAGRRWNRPPALLALVGAILVIAGRLWLQLTAVSWAGVVFLSAASVWDVFSAKRARCTGNGACWPSAPGKSSLS